MLFSHTTWTFQFKSVLETCNLYGPNLLYFLLKLKYWNKNLSFTHIPVFTYFPEVLLVFSAGDIKAPSLCAEGSGYQEPVLHILR